MTTYYDVPADLLIASLSETPTLVQRPCHKTSTSQKDWWHTRAASVLRKVAIKGPIGTNRISQEFGGSKDRGVKKNKAVAGSRNVARKILQQLSDSGLFAKNCEEITVEESEHATYHDRNGNDVNRTIVLRSIL